MVGSVVELHGARVVPAHLEQVGEQDLEALHLGAQQLRGTCGRRRERLALVVQDVAGEPDGGQRRTQLVRDIRDESLLHLRQRRKPHDLFLQAVGHPVERPCKGRDDVVATLRDAAARARPAASFSAVSAASRTGPTTSRTTT